MQNVFVSALGFIGSFFMLIVFVDFIIEGVGLSFRIEVVFLQNMAMWAHLAALFIAFDFENIFSHQQYHLIFR